MSDMIRVAVIDDHPAIPESLSGLLAGKMGFEFVGSAENPDDAYRLIKDEKPDYAVVDLSLNGGSGMDVLRRIKEEGLDTKAIVYSVHRGTLHAERALRAGAKGYVRKRQSLDKLFEAIRDVSNGMLYLDEEVEEQIFERIISGDDPESGFLLDLLTDREMSVFRLLGKGRTVDEIADEIGVASKTIETYRRRARKKLGLDTTNDLLQFAIHWVETGGE